VITVTSAGAEDVRDNSVHCFILMYTSGLAVVIKRICYVTLCYVMLIDFFGADTGGVQVFGGRCLGGGHMSRIWLRGLFLADIVGELYSYGQRTC